MYPMRSFVLLLIVMSAADAATFCVGSSSELMNALTIAETNGEDNTIRIKQGDYLSQVSVGFAFTYKAESNQDLTLSGGWSDFNQIGCMTQHGGPLDTVLDGNNSVSVIHLSHVSVKPMVNISVENLTISNGYSDSITTPGMTAYFHPGHQGTFSLDRVMFYSNNSETAPISALYNFRSYLTRITNSVFMFNENKDGYGAAYINQIQESEGVYFINNTLINNIDNQNAPISYTTNGLFIILAGDMNDAPQGLIANNLFWNNDHNDITALGEGTYYLYNNNYQEREGEFADDVDNISEDPLLAPQLLDFTPQPGSPLIDRGKQEPIPFRGSNFFLQLWTYGDRDFDGGVLGRVVNNQVDIGAVEALPEVPIFEDDFEG